MLGSLARDLAANRLRRGLSILGVIMGSAAVIASLAVMEGGREHIHWFIDRLGVNLLFLEDMYEPPSVSVATADAIIKGGGSPQKSRGPEADAKRSLAGRLFGGRPGALSRDETPGPQTLTIKDMRALERRFPDAIRIEPQLLLRADAARVGERATRVTVEGGTLAGAAIRNLAPTHGRYLDALDIENGRAVCVLGSGLAGKLFPSGAAMGEYIVLFGARWRVVGTLEPKGSVMKFDYDDRVFVPITALQERTGMNIINGVLFQARDTASALKMRGAVEEAAGEMLPDRKPEELRVFCQDELLAQKEQTLQTFKILAACIAAFSLIVSGIGIMNIMLVSVKERTREIGVWKAVGATDRDVLNYFLLESALTCAIGGVLGVALGVFLGAEAARFIARTVTETQGWAPVFKPSFFALSLGAATLVGLVSGIFPAVSAARLDPSEALRYE